MPPLSPAISANERRAIHPLETISTSALKQTELTSLFSTVVLDLHLSPVDCRLRYHELQVVAEPGHYANKDLVDYLTATTFRASEQGFFPVASANLA